MGEETISVRESSLSHTSHSVRPHMFRTGFGQSDCLLRIKNSGTLPSSKTSASRADNFLCRVNLSVAVAQWQSIEAIEAEPFCKSIMPTTQKSQTRWGFEGQDTSGI